jgi:uncharacterized protein
MEQRLSMVTLGVADMGRARRFYEEGLGWQRGNKEDAVTFYEVPGGMVGLYARQALADDARVSAEGSGFSGLTLAYNTRNREEVDAVLAEAVAAGAKLIKPAEEVFWGGYSGYFADPDGHLWEVAWNPFWTIDGEGRVRLSP